VITVQHRVEQGLQIQSGDLGEVPERRRGVFMDCIEVIFWLEQSLLISKEQEVRSTLSEDSNGRDVRRKLFVRSKVAKPLLYAVYELRLTIRRDVL
jgi:hypothetical protein